MLRIETQTSNDVATLSCTGRLVYGFVPPKLYDRIRVGVLDAARAGGLSRVNR